MYQLNGSSLDIYLEYTGQWLVKDTAFNFVSSNDF